ARLGGLPPRARPPPPGAGGRHADARGPGGGALPGGGGGMIVRLGEGGAALGLRRVWGSPPRRFAEAAVAAYIGTVEKPLVDADATVLEHAKAQAVSIDGASRLALGFPRLFARHLRDVINRGRAARLHTMDYTT